MRRRDGTDLAGHGRLRTGSGRASGDGLPLLAWLADESDSRTLLELLREVIDPELGVNIVDLGLVYGVEVIDRTARVRMTLTTPGCPLGAYLDAAIHASLWGAPGVDDVDIEIVWDFPWTAESMNEAAKTALGWRQ